MSPARATHRPTATVTLAFMLVSIVELVSAATVLEHGILALCNMTVALLVQIVLAIVHVFDLPEQLTTRPALMTLELVEMAVVLLFKVRARGR